MKMKMKVAEKTKALAMLAIAVMAGYIAVVGAYAASKGVAATFDASWFIGVLFIVGGVLGISEVAFERKKKKLSLLEMGALVLICVPAVLLGVGHMALWAKIADGQILLNLFGDFTWVLSGALFLLMLYELFIDDK